MLPPIVSRDTKSPGEGELFELLRDDPKTDGWTVLHSLDLADHVARPFGEADFVVVVPRNGVVVIEVKAVRSLRRRNGLWFYGSSGQGRARGPFAQAREAMHSVRAALNRRVGDISMVTFSVLVVFPYIDFHEESPEWRSWEVADRRALSGRGTADCILGTLRNQRGVLGVPEDARGDADKYERIIASLRPDFEVYDSPRSRVQRLDEEVVRFTAEQFEALDAMEANPRVIFDAPAGAGKTVLAIESARRASVEGGSVFLCCYHSALGERLKQEVAEYPTDIVAGTLREWMANLAGADDTDDDHLTEQALEILLEGRVRPFGRLVIDEAQDLFQEGYLDVLDLALEGGLRDGSWNAFGDLTNQVVFSNSDPLAVVNHRFAGVPKYRLTRNCRNTPRIASLAALVGQLRLGYGDVLRSDDAVDPEWRFFSTNEEQLHLLIETLDGLLAEGFAPRDIAVLSFGSPGVASELAGPWDSRTAAEGPPGNHATVSTVSDFKGLEAGAVVLTDLRTFSTPTHRNLLYVGATRALHRLTILADTDVREAIRHSLID